MAFKTVNPEDVPQSSKFLDLATLFPEVGSAFSAFFIEAGPEDERDSYDRRRFVFEVGSQAKTLNVKGQLEAALAKALENGMAYGDGVRITLAALIPTSRANPKRVFRVAPVDTKGKRPTTPNPAGSSAPSASEDNDIPF